jgi:hypothetical protein
MNAVTLCTCLLFLYYFLEEIKKRGEETELG